jgi:hypothetical protein
MVSDNVWELHTCSKPGLKGNWLNRRFIRECYYLLEDIGATHVIAFHWGVGFEKMLDDLGFSVGDTLSVLDVKGIKDGRYLWRKAQGPTSPTGGKEGHQDQGRS